GKSYVGPWYCPRFDGPLDEWKATKQMEEFLRIRKAKEEGQRNRGRAKPKSRPVSKKKGNPSVRLQKGRGGCDSKSAGDLNEEEAPQIPKQSVPCKRATPQREAEEDRSKRPRCTSCNREKTAQTGHRKPWINGRSAGWYCPIVDGDFDQWLDARKTVC
ncbi:hypothetical protein FOZ63_014470, partial [Perkinsus olseni]